MGKQVITHLEQVTPEWLTAVLFFINPLASNIAGAALMAFALLESVFDLCVGCIVYTYIVLPLMGEST